MPSKLPEASLDNYSVDLDDTTGVYHVFLRKASLRTSLTLEKSPKLNYSSHFVEFSNGEMKAVPRVELAVTSRGGEAEQIQHEECQPKTSFTQPDTALHQNADNQPSLAGSLVSTSSEASVHAAPTRTASDSSIAELGPVVGQQAADDQCSLYAFSESILHAVLPNATAFTCFEAEGPNAEERVHTPVDIKRSETYSSSRRSSIGSQDSGSFSSTVPTSPRSSTFSMTATEKFALADLPEILEAPVQPTYMTDALALEEIQHNILNNAIDLDETIPRLLGLDLKLTHRQLERLDEIEDSASPCLSGISASRSGLSMTEDGQIILTAIPLPRKS